MTQPIIYVASAGTGKTTALMDELQQALETTTPETVVYTTFTNAGATEARDRAMARFPKYNEKQFKYFRTLHSIANRAIESRNMMSASDYIKFGQQVGLFINVRMLSKNETFAGDFGKGDKLIHLDALKRLKRCTFQDVAATQEGSFFSAHEIEDFSEKYRKFRNDNHVYDFTDQLEHFLDLIQSGRWGAKLTHLFVDEAQDLSPLQWAIVDEISKIVDRVVIAGDDKQSIYGFSGGDPRKLIYKEAERKVLSTSYRLPENILKFSETIAGRIIEKQDYVCTSNTEGGHVGYVWSLDEVDLSTGSWLLLVRNRKFLEYFEYYLQRKGILFVSDSGNSIMDVKLLESIEAWNTLIKGYPISAREAKVIYSKYLRGSDTVTRGFKQALNHLDDDESVTYDDLANDYGLCTQLPWNEIFYVNDMTREALMKMEADEGLSSTPRIRIATIHGVKGQEADNVVLLPDLAYLTNNNFTMNPDDEHRVFYVGVTRAKKNLYIHQPITDKYYPL